MDRAELRRLLDAVADGTVEVSAAESVLGTAPLEGFTDLGFARLDSHRGLRTGDPEVVYAAGKTVDQVVALLHELSRQQGHRPALATRLSPDMVTAVRDAFPAATLDETARCVAVGDLPTTKGSVAVVSAGTSDAAVAAEAAFVARAYGAAVTQIVDVGVAGI